MTLGHIAAIALMGVSLGLATPIVTVGSLIWLVYVIYKSVKGIIRLGDNRSYGS